MSWWALQLLLLWKLFFFIFTPNRRTFFAKKEHQLLAQNLHKFFDQLPISLYIFMFNK